MRDSLGQEFYATLTRLDDKSATFTVGTATRTVALDGLAAQWSGRYTLLWRMPPVARKNIRLGERGPDVAWLSKQLALVQGRAADSSADPVFDEAMASQVKQFQLVQGLTPDGAVGSQTLIRLSSAADRTAPKLSRDQGKK
jgi:general secretion pathway protein A